MFVLPSIICAYAASYPSLYFIWKALFKNSDDVYQASIVPTVGATLLAISVGLLIPTISAIVPIIRSLSKSLTDALNVAKASTSGVLVSITGSREARIIPFVLFGSLCVAIGVSIYILLP